MLPWRRARAFVLFAGRAAGRCLPLRNSSGLFFFFPFYQVGGAEKIHADIVACVADHHRPWIFFTNPSKDAKFKPLFEKSARLFDISFLTPGSLRYYGYVAALASFINRHERAVVFGCNTVLFYDLIPRLKADVRRIDLLHAFGGGIEHVSLAAVSEIDTRVVYSSRAFNELKEQYRAARLDTNALLNRIAFIDNQVPVPDNYTEKGQHKRLQLLYVGRGSAEKRVHLIGRAAARLRRAGAAADFILVGDVRAAIEAEHQSSCIFKGEIADPLELNELYAEADALLLTSSREGFPMAIMEAMAHAVVPISTDVGGIPDHVKHNVNGILIENGEEEQIVEALCEAVNAIERDRALLKEMSREAYRYARQHFAPERFCAAYRQLLLQEKPQARSEREDLKRMPRHSS
ncbi:MAG TPA: glycosyltransferase family 4 protein [Pyrinomonadaceae bacterium]|nr:glycosyltransferase family 4 protein [Pyrinomonadaceae bacterium]